MERKTSENEKVYHQVIEHITNLATTKEISFGSKIPSERELMATLGFSRNSIREALRTMENMGIIESRQGQGNFLVNHIGESLSGVFSMLLSMEQTNYIEISQLRRFIEIGAYLLAVKSAKEDLDCLSEILDEMELVRGEERAKLDKKFHDQIVLMSDNHLLELLNEALSGVFEIFISEMSKYVTDEDKERLVCLHRNVYENLRKKDVSEGIERIREHYNIIDRNLQMLAEKYKGVKVQ
mgnify:FL=1